MKQLIKKHKTTITGILTALLLLIGVVRWTLGQIDATELGAYSGIIAGIAASIVAMLAKDGEYRKNA